MKKTKGQRLPIILGGIVLILLVGGTAAWKYQLISVRGIDEERTPAESPAPYGVNFLIKDQTINLADTNPARYLKIEVALEIMAGKGPKPNEAAYKKAQEHVSAELSPDLPALEDTVISTLSVMKSAELLTQSGKERVKQELIRRMQPLIGERKILNVYFRQFIIQ